MNRIILASACLALTACGTSSGGGGGGGFVGGTSSGGAVDAGSDGGSSGGSSSGGTSSSSGGGGNACAAVASAVCGKLFGCLDLVAVPWFGDKTMCETRYKASCERKLKLPDVSSSLASQMQSCATTISNGSCDVMLDTANLQCMNPAGTRDSGLACASNVQCKTSYCKKPSGEECGVCAPKKGSGSECPGDAACDAGMSCLKGKCGKISIVGGGDACDGEAKVCAFGFGCVANVCKKQGDGGAACDPAAKSADCRIADKLLYCKPDAKACTKISVAESTGDCSDGATLCKAGYCPKTGTCIPRVGDGEDCDEAAGKFCLLPAQCAKGVCTLPSPNKCN